LKNRIFNIISIVLILLWIWADRHFQMGAPVYEVLLVLYVSVLFCGSYFIQWNFFLQSIHAGSPQEKSIALTFDDGPAGEKTARLLDVLKDNHAEAAFFCIGKNVENNHQLLKRIPAEGHMIGNHSYSHHRFFDLFSSRKMLEELNATREICRRITGLSPRFFRPPYGVTNPNLKKAVLQGGFISIGWSVRSLDTVIQQEERLLRKILKAIRPGAIVLLHDTSDTTLAILPQLLATIRSRGYSIVRLDKMLKLNPYD
jgi:peptidoglycan/xylan/chitin deacetylase (PgdA/CDA1 family)